MPSSPTSWDQLRAALRVGERITGTVLRHEPYGVLVDIGHEHDGLIQVTDLADDGVMTPDSYPAVGSEVEAVVLGFKEHGHQVWLGLRPSQLERSRR